ncbi:MAG: hypothetical protein HDS26_03570 [Bacteroides sp.]|nr:hypothetical protein [Bacteroides sp.]MBD5306048.1 hypothetical protein [Bacteroides sp.]
MKPIFRHFIGAAMVAAALPAMAQGVNSGYFMDYYTYSHQLNPAFQGSDKGYVGFPGLGNINVGAHGNFHVSDVVRYNNGRTMLFTNPSISVSEAMKNFKNNNKIGAGAKIGIIDFGFKAFGGYNTIGINAVAQADVSVPKSLFSLMKEGVGNETYDISDVRADAVGYAEIALNHSRQIKQVPGLRVGASVKFLVGIAAIQAKFNEAYLQLDQNSWNAVTDAEIYSMVKGFRYDTDYNEHTNRNYVSGANIDDFSAPNGFGLAFDLGGEYKWKDFTFSFALLDLGFISFSDTYKASTMGRRSVRTDAYTFQVSGEGSSDEWDRIRDDFSELYQMEDCGNIGSHTYGLKATMNIGVAYELPVYRKIKFGLLNSTRFAGPMTATEFRLSANWQPFKLFSANINGVAGTYGAGFGWMLNLHAPGFNMFLGMDHTLGKLAKQGIPLNSNADVFLGINFPF